MSQSSASPNEEFEFLRASSASTRATDEAATERLVAWLARFRAGHEARRKRQKDLQEHLKWLRIRSSRLSSLPIAVLATVLVVAITLGVGAGLMGALSSEAAFTLVAIIVTAAGLLVALLQWRIGLSEQAFDALYRRIELGNKMRLAAFEGVSELPDSPPEERDRTAATKNSELYRFFVYTEIDSFEYATRRYQSGLGLSSDIVARAIRHFESRCAESQTFREVASECIKGAYFDETKERVQAILQDRARTTSANDTSSGPSDGHMPGGLT